MNLIAQHLQNTGTSQAAFAKLVGVSQATVWDWAKGNKRPTGDRVRPVAAALGITPEALVLSLHLPPAGGAVVHGLQPAPAATLNAPNRDGAA